MTKADGSIRIDTKLLTSEFEKGIIKLKNSLNNFANAMGIAFSTVAIVNFGKSCVSTAMEVENSFVGLQSIIAGQGRSWEQANKFIKDYISDGLVPLQNAVTAYKNLASRGYDDEQIKNVMIALKNSATYGRQASLTLGYAVQSAAEGLKNENSILVDNAGVTKNVSVMWKEYANQIGVSYTELTKQQKIQAEVNGILEETKFQMGDAEKASNTFTGQIARLSTNFTNLKNAIGNSIIPILEKIVPYLNAIILKLTVIFEKFANINKVLFGSKINDNSLSPITNQDLSSDIDTATDSTEELTNATEELAEAQEELNEQVKGNLASFDELEVISFDTPTENKSSVNDDTEDLADNTEAIDNLNNATADLSDTTDDYTIKNSKLLESLKALKAQLDRLGDFAGQALIDFYEHFLKPLGDWTVNEALPRFINALADGMAKVNWQGINDALIRLWDALEPFAETVGDGLLWFWENVLVPLGTWTLNNIVPVFLEILANTIELLNTIIIAFKPFGLWLWNEFLLPIARWTGGAIVSILQSFANVIKELTEYITDNQDELETWIPLLSGIAMAIASAFAIKKISKFAPTLLKIGSVIGGLAGKVKIVASAFTSLASSQGIVTALTTSISGLWTTFSAFMTSLSPLAKVTVTVAGLVATFTTAYSAMKKLNDGTITVTQALKNIIPVMTLVGVSLYAMMGPIGAVITIIGTLAGAMLGLVKSSRDMAQNLISNAVFNDIGTPITEYANTIHNLADTISSEQDKILSLGNTIESNNQNIENNLTDLGMLIGQVNATGETTEENANKIISSFNAVADGISENLSLGTQSIIEGLGTSFTDLAGASGTMVSDMLSQLYLLQSEGDAYLATMKSDFAEANMEMLSLEKGTPEYEKASKKVEELGLQISEYSAITNDAITSADLFKQSLSNINNEVISLMDAETATQSINDMTNDYSKAMSDLEEARAVALKGVENEMKALEYRQGELTSEDVKYFDNLANLINENYNSQENELSKTFEDIITKIKNQVNTTVESATNDAVEEALSTIGGKLDYWSEFYKNFFKSFDTVTATTDTYKSYRDKLSSSVTENTDKALKEAEFNINQNKIRLNMDFDNENSIKNAEKSANEIGKNVDEGYAKGISDNANKVVDSITSVGEQAHQGLQIYNDSHSPSRLYEKDGEYIDEGLALGIDNKKQLVISSLLAVATEMKNQINTALNPMPNIFDEVFNRILNSMNNFNYNLSNGIKDTLNNIINDLNTLFNNISQVNFELPMGYGNFGVNIPQIPHLATGGLIPPRQEFMAILGDNTRENEIVSPISTMKQAVLEAIKESGFTNDKPIQVYLDGKIVFDNMQERNRQYKKQTGKSAF